MKLIYFLIILTMSSTGIVAFAEEVNQSTARVAVSFDSTQSEHYQLSVEYYSDHQNIFITGHIFQSDRRKIFKDFEKIDPSKDVVIFLGRMRGGYLPAIIAVKERLQSICSQTRCKITTVVEEHSVCYSACLYLFLAGDDRLLGTEATLAAHTVSIGSIELDFMWSKYIDAGISEEWMAANCDHPPESRCT